MTETAETVIKDALTEIVVLGAEAPLEAADAQVAIRYLNRMMASLDVDGIDIGYTEVTTLADPITVPAGAIEAIVFGLAARLWTQYSDGQPVPIDLAAKVRAGKDVLFGLAGDIGATEYPDTLPRGSGNSEYGYHYDRFYTDLQPTILSESNGSISLEDDTADNT